MQAWIMVDSACELSNLCAQLSESFELETYGLNIEDWDPQWGQKVETPIIGSVDTAQQRAVVNIPVQMAGRFPALPSPCAFLPPASATCHSAATAAFLCCLPLLPLLPLPLQGPTARGTWAASS